MQVYVAPQTTPIEEFCLPLLACDSTGLVRLVIDEFTSRYRTTDLSSFVLHLLNDRLLGRDEDMWSEVPGMSAAAGMPLRHIWTEDGEYYDFYNDPYYCM